MRDNDTIIVFKITGDKDFARVMRVHLRGLRRKNHISSKNRDKFAVIIQDGYNPVLPWWLEPSNKECRQEKKRRKKSTRREHRRKVSQALHILKGDPLFEKVEFYQPQLSDYLNY